MYAEEEFSSCWEVSIIQTTVSFSLTIFTTLLITAIPCYAQQIGSPVVLIPHVNGNWYNVQPNGSFVHVPTNRNDYYQSRENDGTVRLIRQVDTTQSNDASYCCQLLDATSTMQTLCATIGK